MIDRLKSLKFINNGIIKKEIPSGVIKLGKDLNKYMEANNLSFPESFLFDAVLVDEGQLFEGEWWKLTKVSKTWWRSLYSCRLYSGRKRH